VTVSFEFTFVADSELQLAWTTPFQYIAFAAPVPEPSTWAMLLIGFGGIGFARFCKSRSSVAVLIAAPMA
jgi:hypothetical protein